MSSNFHLLLVNVVDTKISQRVPTSTALYLEVEREVGLSSTWPSLEIRLDGARNQRNSLPGRPDVLAVRMDLESDQAMRGIFPKVLVLLKEQEGVIRLEM